MGGRDINNDSRYGDTEDESGVVVRPDTAEKDSTRKYKLRVMQTIRTV